MIYLFVASLDTKTSRSDLLGIVRGSIHRYPEDEDARYCVMHTIYIQSSSSSLLPLYTPMVLADGEADL